MRELPLKAKRNEVKRSGFLLEFAGCFFCTTITFMKSTNVRPSMQLSVLARRSIAGLTDTFIPNMSSSSFWFTIYSWFSIHFVSFLVYSFFLFSFDSRFTPCWAPLRPINHDSEAIGRKKKHGKISRSTLDGLKFYRSVLSINGAKKWNTFSPWSETFFSFRT